MNNANKAKKANSTNTVLPNIERQLKRKRTLPSLVGASSILWQGRWYDEDVELYYYRYRNFNIKDDRFMQRDPIGVWGDPANFGNGYALCAGNPWNGLDPWGLEDCSKEQQSLAEIAKKCDLISKEIKKYAKMISESDGNLIVTFCALLRIQILALKLMNNEKILMEPRNIHSDPVFINNGWKSTKGSTYYIAIPAKDKGEEFLGKHYKPHSKGKNIKTTIKINGKWEENEFGLPSMSDVSPQKAIFGDFANKEDLELYMENCIKAEKGKGNNVITFMLDGHSTEGIRFSHGGQDYRMSAEEFAEWCRKMKDTYGVHIQVVFGYCDSAETARLVVEKSKGAVTAIGIDGAGRTHDLGNYSSTLRDNPSENEKGRFKMFTYENGTVNEHEVGRHILTE